MPSPARWKARYTTRTSVAPRARIGTYTRNASGGYGDVPKSPPPSNGDHASGRTPNAVRAGIMPSAYGLRPYRSRTAEYSGHERHTSGKDGRTTTTAGKLSRQAYAAATK